MKKINFSFMGFLLVLMLIFGLAGGPVFAQSKVVLVGGNKAYKNLTDFVTMDKALNLGTGKTYYVDSGLSAAGLGTSWESALTTVDAAINKCTASNGDVIMVAPGHAESFTAANGFDLDVAGVTIYMLGEGSNAPTFTFADTDATIAIGAAGCKIVGGRYLAGISEVVTGISIEAGGDDVTLDSLIFPEPGTSTFEFDKAIVLASGADRVTIQNCISYSCDATGATDWLDMTTGVNNGTRILYNTIIGEYSQAPIYSDKADLETFIIGNNITNMTTGQFAIEFSAAATGMCLSNALYTDDEAAALDPGSMKCIENYVTTAIDASGVLVPAADDTAQNFIGVNDADNAADTSTVVSNANGSVLERLEALAVATLGPTKNHPNYLAVSTGTFDTTGTWSTAASHEIATVTGMVKMLIIPECTASVSSVGDTGTIALGDETTANSIIAASTLGSGVMVTGELWVDATLTRTILTQTQLNGLIFVVANGKDIGYTIATNAAAGGSMKFHIWWVPLDATGAVVAGAGGTL